MRHVLATSPTVGFLDNRPRRTVGITIMVRRSFWVRRRHLMLEGELARPVAPQPELRT